VVTEKQCFVMVAFMLAPVHVSRQSDAKKVTEQRLLSGMVGTGRCPTCSGSLAVAVLTDQCWFSLACAPCRRRSRVDLPVVRRRCRCDYDPANHSPVKVD
jgi:hypothetical protein